MKTLAMVTSSRSDFSLYVPLLRALRAHPSLQPEVIATGMHLAPAFGLTVRQIEEAGFTVQERVESLIPEGTPEAVAGSIGRGVVGFSKLFARRRPDVLIVLGDRYDMFPAALAALPFRIPVAHIAGGELTEGAIDDALRHSLTKLSHVHFVATPSYAARVLQLGEEPWRVAVVGALGVDHVRQTPRWPREVTATRFDLDLARPVALVTYHPVTLEYERTAEHVEHLLQALAAAQVPCVFTAPNADTSWTVIRAAIERFCAARPRARLVLNAGAEGYLNLMNVASLMVGNSSSGLVEAPSFELPVVNIGARQAGRVRGINVVDCGVRAEEIGAAMARACDPAFRASLRGMANPYGDGHAAERIAARLATLEASPEWLRKTFTTPANSARAELVPA